MRSVLYSVLGVAVLGGGIALAVFAGSSGETAAPQAPKPPLVEVAEVVAVERPPALVTTGFIRAADRLAITAEVAGRVVDVAARFELGGRIEAGTPLVQLEKTTYEAELLRAESALSGAESARQQAKNALDRQKELASRDFASDATVEQLEANLAAAEAELVGAEAALRLARKALADTTLSAPFDALVVSEDVAEGRLLQPGQTVGEVVRSDEAELRTALTETDFRRFNADGGIMGRTLTIRPRNGGEPAEAEVSSVSPQIDGAARMVEIVATIEKPFEGGTPLLLNALVDVDIPLPAADDRLLSIPLAALQTGQRLWKISGDNTLLPVNFRIERRTGDKLFLLSDDLAPGDRVLVTALQTQIEGREVRIARDAKG